jgi:hypothetical protein
MFVEEGQIKNMKNLKDFWVGVKKERKNKNLLVTGRRIKVP